MCLKNDLANSIEESLCMITLFISSIVSSEPCVKLHFNSKMILHGITDNPLSSCPLTPIKEDSDAYFLFNLV